MRNLIDLIDRRGDGVMEVTVEVECDAVDKPKDVGGVVVGVLGLGLALAFFFSEECGASGCGRRIGGDDKNGNAGTGGTLSLFALVLRA
jgi:hypothetical protein